MFKVIFFWLLCTMTTLSISAAGTTNTNRKPQIPSNPNRSHIRTQIPTDLDFLRGKTLLNLGMAGIQLRKPCENALDNPIAPRAHERKRILCICPDAVQ